MSKISISLIMPVYNAESTLGRALASIPISKNTQVILIDDGSTDGSWRIMQDWYDAMYDQLHKDSLLLHQDNQGVAKTMNRGFDLSKGEYIVSLSSDDYYVTNFERFEPYLDGKNDLIYFDLVVNNGEIWHVDEKSKDIFVGAVKFMRRKFLGDTRIPDLKWHEDVPFSKELYAKNPKEVFTGIVLKHYDWPRENSLTWQANRDKNAKL